MSISFPFTTRAGVLMGRASRANQTFWWASSAAQVELELLRLAYAELLARWQLDHIRLDVLKLCRSATPAANLGSFGRATVRAGNGYDPRAEIGASSSTMGP